jgi:hypothetical protein
LPSAKRLVRKRKLQRGVEEILQPSEAREVKAMKQFLLHLSLALGILLLAETAPPPAYARQSDQDPGSTAPQKPDAAGVPPQHANEAQMPASGETTTETAKTFSGIVVKENGEVVLKDPVTKVVYRLDDVAKAKRFVGKRVKVMGKLEMNSNKILIESIEPIS